MMSTCEGSGGLGESAWAVIRGIFSRSCTCALRSELGLVLKAGLAWWSAPALEGPSILESDFDSLLFWRDSFPYRSIRGWTVERPPLEELQRTVYDLCCEFLPKNRETERRPHGDPLRLESSSICKAQFTSRRLHSLMTEMEAEQHNPDDQALLACQAEVLKVLVDGLGEIAARVDGLHELRDRKPDFVPKLVWAVTWLVLPLLMHSQLKDSQEDKESVAVSWTLLHRVWPDFCGNTKYALDVFRRFALLECGHNGQVVAGFEARRWFFKDGFQECELWVNMGNRYVQFNRHDRAAECIGEARKYAESASKSHPQVWPYVNLILLYELREHLTVGNWSQDAREAEAAFLRNARRADLRMRFNDSSPPELSHLDKLKLDILDKHVGIMETTWRNLRDLREPVSELPGDMRIGIVDRMRYLQLRGSQLLMLKRFEEGMETLHRVLVLTPLALAEEEESDFAARFVHEDCRRTMEEALKEQCDVDGIDRSEEIRAITSKFLDPGPRIVGSIDTTGLIVHVRRVTEGVETLLRGWNAVMDFKCTTYPWAAWQDLSVSMQSLAEKEAKLCRMNVMAAEDGVGNVGERYSWILKLQYAYYTEHIFMIHQLTPTWPPPAQDCISGAELTLEAYVHQLSRQALLYAERVRPCSVLPQASQPRLVQAASGSDKQALDDLEWQMIRESQRACGANTLFVAYVEWGDPAMIWLVDCDGSISHWRPDFTPELPAMVDALKDAVFTMSQLPHVPGKNDGRRKLTESELTACLEYWYDCLVLPLQNKYPLFPHHKVVIVATGFYASYVPFHILRNRRSGKYLFQEVTLSVVPSFRLLHQCLKRYEELQTLPLFGPGAAVAVGNPIYQPPTCQLPGSQEEVLAICQLFNTPLANPGGSGYQVHKLLQKEATILGFLDWTATKPCAIEPHSQGFIHIAAHARVDEIYPRGALMLTGTGGGSKVNSAASPGWRPRPSASASTSTSRQPSSASSALLPEASSSLLPEATMLRLKAVVEEDAEFVRAPAALDDSAGLLPSHWILSSGSRWSAYMVVLSACNSANGQVEPYGTLSLSRAFLFRGIPCSVVSRWPVADKITVHLMTLFYEEMRQGQDVSSALRSAMVSMLDDGYQLHHLAAFIVNGLPIVRLPQQLRAAA